MSSSPSTGPSPELLWQMVTSRVFEAQEKSPKKAEKLIYPVVDPEDSEPLGTLVSSLDGRDPAELYQKYQSLGGPDPRKAEPLQVLRSFLGLFEMWTETPQQETEAV